ncbi:sensor histidine kinase [Sediminivirga luteola]|uniref:sensor histidine kinase n=1 Tax=Sediminivirga luteola TaxID=1774748 RepID=UPI001F579C93|nr:histidine kinase [Sediminivirga luteola]MCI2263982.1 histidine kinase [Sediminivirga luteola]
MTPARPRLRAPDRSTVVAASVVGVLSIAVTTFYLWTVAGIPGAWQLLGFTPGRVSAWFALIVFQSAALLWVRRAPATVLVVVFGLTVAATALAIDAGAGMALPLWFAVFTAVVQLPPARSVPLVAGVYVAHMTVHVWLFQSAGFGTLSGHEVLLFASNRALFYLACIAVAFAVRNHRDEARRAQEHVTLADSKVAAEARAATGRERARIARELHDLAAHQLVDVVMLARTGLIEGRTDGGSSRRDASQQLLAQIEERGSAALASVREAVAALREEDTGARSDADLGTGSTAAPGTPLRQWLGEIVAEARQRRETEIEFGFLPGAEPPPPVCRAMAAVLKEALANAAAHAPGYPVRVAVGTEPGRVTMQVDNPLPEIPAAPDPGRTGYGLIGMHERADHIGGTLQARPRDGVWTVRMEAPCEAGHAAAPPASVPGSAGPADPEARP